MRSYAGIGSRQITDEERHKIKVIAKKLADAGFIVYSGNAEGSDVSFQEGSEGKCVLLLPWKGFNKHVYDVNKSIDQFEVGKSDEGQATIEKYHPSPKSLTYGGRLMMARNWHQIVGWEQYPQVEFVICCANRDNSGKILGGTGQACRIAEEKGISVFNIRDETWMEDFNNFIKDK
jgi:hypothetical protein